MTNIFMPLPPHNLISHYELPNRNGIFNESLFRADTLEFTKTNCVQFFEGCIAGCQFNVTPYGILGIQVSASACVFLTKDSSIALYDRVTKHSVIYNRSISAVSVKHTTGLVFQVERRVQMICMNPVIQNNRYAYFWNEGICCTSDLSGSYTMVNPLVSRVPKPSYSEVSDYTVPIFLKGASHGENVIEEFRSLSKRIRFEGVNNERHMKVLDAWIILRPDKSVRVYFGKAVLQMTKEAGCSIITPDLYVSAEPNLSGHFYVRQAGFLFHSAIGNCQARAFGRAVSV